MRRLAWDIAEQQVAALLPPDRTFGGPELAAEPIGQFLDRLGHRDDLLELRRELIDPLGVLRPAGAQTANRGECGGRSGRAQYLPARERVPRLHGDPP
jgi:hypothetical protein